jgi:hypothetical protein
LELFTRPLRLWGKTDAVVSEILYEAVAETDLHGLGSEGAFGGGERFDIGGRLRNRHICCDRENENN